MLILTNEMDINIVNQQIWKKLIIKVNDKEKFLSFEFNNAFVLLKSEIEFSPSTLGCNFFG